MIPVWVNDYTGLPFKDFGRDRSGLDCWGLYRLIAAEIFGVDLPSYLEGYGSALDRASVGSHIETTVQDNRWTEVQPGQERAGDAIVTRIHRLPAHVGMVVAPRQFIHIQSGCETVVEDYSRPKWKSVIVGFFRHADMKVAS